MVEPYASLVPLIIGCVATIGIIWLISEFTRNETLKAKRRKLLNPTIIFMWIVVVAFGLASLTISKAGEGAVWLFLWAWLGAGGLAGVVIIKVIEYTDLDDSMWHSRLFCAWSIVGMLILTYGMWSFGSDTAAPKGDTPISAEYSVAPDGSRSPVVASKYQLSQDESGNWVSTAEEAYTSAKDGSRKSHTVYTWREIQAPNVPAALAVTTTKSSHLDENDIVVVEDVQEGESGWVEHIPMYYLAPESVFNPSRPDPIQGNLCVLGRDNGCKANVKPAYEKIVLHVPAGTAK